MDQGTINTFNDEIDLLQLAKRFANLIKRRFKIILLSILGGLIIGLTTYFSQTPTYKSTLIGNSEILRNEYVTLLFKNLNELLKEGNHEAIAEILKISLKDAKSIVKIEATPVDLKDTKTAINAENLVYTFQIDILVIDPKNLDRIQSGILYYIQNNDFVKKRVDLQKVYIESMINKIDNEINKMDTTRSLFNKLYGKNSTSMINSDPTSFNNSLITLHERKLTLKNSLVTLNQVLVIQNFIKYSKPVSPKLNILIPAGIITGLLVGLGFIFILELRRKFL